MVNHDRSREGGSVAMYLRVSSANQDVQLSIAAQMEAISLWCRPLAVEVQGLFILLPGR